MCLSEEVPTHTPSVLAPKAVTRTAAKITSAGFEPRTHYTTDGRWHTEVEEADTHALLEFTQSLSGKTTLTKQTITVADEPAVAVCCVDCVLDNLKRARNRARGPVLPDPVSNELPIEQAPVIVQRSYSMIIDKLPADAVVTTGSIGDHRWVLAIDLPTSTVRIYYRQHGNRWRNDKRRPFQLIVNGTDQTDIVGDDMDAMLQMLLGGAAAPAPTSVQSVGRPQDAKAVNSLQVRRSTVIRV